MNPSNNIFYNELNQNENANLAPKQSEDTYTLEKQVSLHNIELSSTNNMGFIQKVYSIIIVQLLLSCLFISFNYIPSFKNFYIETLGLFIFFIIVFVAIIIFLIFFKQYAKLIPVYWSLLSVITLCQCWIFGYIASATNHHTALLAFCCLCALVTGGLLIYTIMNNGDYTFLGALFYAAITSLIALLLVVLIMVYSSGMIPFINLLLCAIFVALYTIFIIKDTQLILSKVGFVYSEDEFVYCALNVYIDVGELISDFFIWTFASVKCC